MVGPKIIRRWDVFSVHLLSMNEQIKNNTYFVTGAAGFIGSNLVMELLKDENRRSEMSRNLRAMARLDCTERMCDIVEQLCKR